METQSLDQIKAILRRLDEFEPELTLFSGQLFSAEDTKDAEKSEVAGLVQGATMPTPFWYL